MRDRIAMVGQRRFLQLAVVGGGAVLGTALRMPAALAAGATEAMLLSCMDYRLVDDIERYMSRRGLRDKYDHVILAGASLGAVTEKFPAWNTTFWEHLAASLDLHHVRTIIVLDHRDCGAYKLILGEDLAKDRARETEVHATKLRLLRTQIVAKHPTLGVETLLMSLDGTVETIT